MRKPMDGEDPKFYSAEKSKCQEWHRIFVLAREIVKSLLIPGRTWTDQNEEMRGFAVKALEMKVDQVCVSRPLCPLSGHSLSRTGR